MKFVTYQVITEFFDVLVKDFEGHGNIYLTGESSIVYKRWQRLADNLEYYAEIEHNNLSDFNKAIQNFINKSGISVLNESPAKIIPLPKGYRQRAIQINVPQKNGNELSKLNFFHFDPYSISFRFIARGDEADYKLVLNFLKNSWINRDMMEKLMEDLLPAFSFETIQQDPAEFRRKYKGLLQMWNALNGRIKEVKN